MRVQFEENMPLTGVSKENVEAIRASNLFDAQWYLKTYPDVKALGMDPAEHYLWLGARLHRDPSPHFHTNSYIKHNPQVVRDGLNPLLHFLATSEANSETRVGPAIRGFMPLTHVSKEDVEAIRASKLFDAQWYLKTYPDVKVLGMDPVEHYLWLGTRLNRDPSPDFSTAGYLQAKPDAAASGTNALLAYERERDGEVRAGTRRKINSCLIVTTPHTVFYARLMEQCLRAEDYTVSITFNTTGYDRFEDLFGYVFVLCPQMYERLPKRYIAIQMEQSIHSRWFTDDYVAKLGSSEAVIDYSKRNVEFLLGRGIDFSKLFYVPLGVNRTKFTETRETSTSADNRSGVVLFYGDDKCPRRHRMLERLAEEFHLKVVNNTFFADIESEILAADVVINIHYYEGALLETVRVFEVLSLGKPLISEKSVDFDEHTELQEVVDFVDVGDVEAMARSIRRILNEDKLGWQQRRDALREFVTERPNRFENYFRRFLLAHNMTSYSRFSKNANGYAPPMPPEPKICLSLPESTVRRQKFIEQGCRDFVFWDGLRSKPGWVGCALSYTHIFRTLRERGVELATVCEDDATFGPEFDVRYGKIVSHLRRRPDWEVFSGFISDLHPDVRILKVEEIDGERFIFLDRTVSMVFNIYRAPIIDYLSRWEHWDRDVETNTIDRYLERRERTVAVTTLPFLVGHREEVGSTIWGFENTQYIELVNQSELRLAQKVEEFQCGVVANERS